MREVTYGRARHAGHLLGVVKSAVLDFPPVRVKPAGRVLYEPPILQTGTENLPSHGIREHDVRADIETEPAVSPLRRTSPARVDYEERGTVVNAFQHVVEINRMGLAGV